MHQSYRTQLSLPEVVTDICCLANVKPGMPQAKDAIAIFHLSSAGKLVEQSSLTIDAVTRGRGNAEKERFSS